MRRLFLSAAAAVVGAVGSARADFVIDNFSTPVATTVNPLGAGVGTQYQATDTLPGGLTRNVVVTQTADFLNKPGDTNAYLGGGVFSLATASGTTAFADLAYTPASGINLSGAGSTVQLTIPAADLNTPFTVRLVSGAFGTSSFASASQYGSVTSSTVGTFTVPISGFTGVDLTNVTGIEVLLNLNTSTASPTSPGTSTPSADFILTNLSVTTPNVTPPSTVPAPPAALLGLLAVPALAFRRRFVSAG